MKVKEINGKEYRLPNVLTDFQRKMYIHLINYKWANITQEPGIYRNNSYDALLPEKLIEELYPLYEPIKDRFKEHKRKYPYWILIYCK